MLTPKIFDHLLICENLWLHIKTNLIPSVHSAHKPILKSRDQIGHTFLTMSNHKIFNQLLIYLNLYQHTKYYAASSICFGDMVHLKILECDWLRPFWSISWEQNFYHTGFVKEALFDQLLDYVNLYQHVKNQAISLICSRDMVD